MRLRLQGKFQAYGMRMNLSQEQIDVLLYRVQTVFDEVFSNAVEHGNLHDIGKNIHVRLQMRDGTVKIKVADESGEFFDPTDSSHPVQRDGLRALSINGLDNDETRAQVAGRRRGSGHAPRRRNGEGGFGVALSQALADHAVYGPHIVSGIVVGTSVDLSWNLNLLKPGRSRTNAP